MKHQYKKRVEKCLNVSRKAKMEVLRDLGEAFASALEHGETEQQVIDRLGAPEDFAKSVQEQFAVSCTGAREWKSRSGIVAAILISVIAFAAAFLIRMSRLPKGVIGQADAATTIRIAGGGVDLFLLTILLGSIALAAAICLVIHDMQKEREEKAK